MEKQYNWTVEALDTYKDMVSKPLMEIFQKAREFGFEYLLKNSPESLPDGFKIKIDSESGIIFRIIIDDEVRCGLSMFKARDFHRKYGLSLCKEIFVGPDGSFNIEYFGIDQPAVYLDTLHIRASFKNYEIITGKFGQTIVHFEI